MPDFMPAATVTDVTAPLAITGWDIGVVIEY